MLASIILGAFFFILSTGTVIFEITNGHGNHWFLFGTWIDHLVLHYPFIISLVFVLPLVIPVFFKESLFYKIVFLSSIPLLFYYLVVFKFLTD